MNLEVRKFFGSEVPTPQPGPGQVLVRMHAVGVNPVETYIRAGTMRESRSCLTRRETTARAWSSRSART